MAGATVFLESSSAPLQRLIIYAAFGQFSYSLGRDLADALLVEMSLESAGERADAALADFYATLAANAAGDGQ